jgi:hypothetical protein
VLTEPQASFLITLMRNGDIVVDFKLALSRGFFDMREKLRSGQSDPFAALPPEHRALVVLMCENAQIKAKQDQLAAVQSEQADSIKRIEARQTGFENGASYFTVIGFGAMRGIKIDLKDAIRIGRRAGALSKERGISVSKVRDVRFGQVNSYHEEVLEAALVELHGGM